MGRPLNKRFFGVEGTGPTASGNEIKVNFHNGSAVKEGYIVKQKGSKKFVCEEIETAGEFTCVLKTGILPAALSAGEIYDSAAAIIPGQYSTKNLNNRNWVSCHPV